ncbi:MAG: YnbE family lipoprotein [Verrucomicrobiota bacterium]
MNFKPSIPFLFAAGLLVGAATLSSCQLRTKHRVETVHEIKPIEININVRIQKELTDFFDDLDSASETIDATE